MAELKSNFTVDTENTDEANSEYERIFLQFNKLQNERRKGLASLSLDSERVPAFGPNYPIGNSATLMEGYKQSTTIAKADANLSIQLDALYNREADPKQEENYIHVGQEGADTSQYGVTQANFPLKEGETYREQAGRVLKDKYKNLDKINVDWDNQSANMKAALTPAMWNLGEYSGAIKEFDFNDVKGSAARLMKYHKYTSPKTKKLVVSKGLKNARIKDWNAIAETDEGIEAGMTTIDKFADYKIQI